MIRFPALLALMSLATPALAQKPKPTAVEGETSAPVQRIRNVQLKKGEPCPKGAADEIVVCGTLEEPYRIPKPLRETKKDAAQQSWVNRAATIDEVGRVAGGLPDTCSNVGTGGQTGCTQKLLRDYAADRAAKKRADSSVP